MCIDTILMKSSFSQDYITKLQQFNQIQRLWYHLKAEIRIFQSMAIWTILQQQMENYNQNEKDTLLACWRFHHVYTTLYSNYCVIRTQTTLVQSIVLNLNIIHV